MFWTCQPVKKRKDTDKLTRTNAFAPCNRVLAIPELRDLLYSFIPSGLSNTATTTTTTNNSNKNPKGASCMLTHNEFAQVIQEQGYRVRKFSCSKVDKSILTSLVQHCHSLEELDLGFGEKSFWMQYDFLELIFINLAKSQQWHLKDWEKGCGRRGLRKVEITLNMLDFRPRMLWSLCQLPYLRDLTINANGSIGDEESLQYLEEVTLYLLECCPRLESFTINYNALTIHRHPFEYRNWLKEKVETEATRGPVTPQDALARCRHISPTAATRLSGWLSEKQGDYYERASTAQDSAQEKPKTWNLRRLVLYGFRPDTSVLPRIFSRCPRLEEIGIHLGWSVIEADTWTSLATHCPNLKVLNISGYSYQYREYDVLSIPELLAMFPRLETINAKDYPRQDFDLQSLDSSLITYGEKKDGEQQGHMLKSLSLVGHGSGSLPKVLGILSSRSFTHLEELKIEYTFSSPSPWLQAKAVTPNISTEGSLLDFSRPWDVVARTLVKLDLHGVQFPDKATTVKFFRRLQDFKSLRVLRASHHHLKDLISTTSLPTSSSPSLTTTPGDILLLPTVDYRLPHIQNLFIPQKWSEALSVQDASDILSLNDILFLLATTPSLKTLSLAKNSISPETAAFVRGAFRQVCLDTNYE
ncbi:hypothetical protein KI688_002819 [Linnemannia hyalina]|uniref:RNI-like protein n=1 Tax=Linnemannia hyalina TaxID=64524 RepID=A0A9P7XRU6_9FUNG|nr:hypothetical protein KI688_002819 [Linnemannia hyalina]